MNKDIVLDTLTILGKKQEVFIKIPVEGPIEEKKILEDTANLTKELKEGGLLSDRKANQN